MIWTFICELAYGKYKWNILKVDKVLMLLGKAYKEKADDREGGVGAETQIISGNVLKLRTWISACMPWKFNNFWQKYSMKPTGFGIIELQKQLQTGGLMLWIKV